MVQIVVNRKLRTESKRSEKVWRRCPQCSMAYGYEIDGGAYLIVGDLKMKYIRAVCGDCGFEFHWGSMDRHLRRATRRNHPSPTD